MAEPATACAWSDLAACLASGEAALGVVVGVVLGIPAGLFALFHLAPWIGRRWEAFWRRRPPAEIPEFSESDPFGENQPDRPTRGQRLRSWWRELWPLWLWRCWRPLAVVVRRLLLPRG